VAFFILQPLPVINRPPENVAWFIQNKNLERIYYPVMLFLFCKIIMSQKPFKTTDVLQILLIPFVLFSCSIEKRHYRPGYHVEWRHTVTVEQYSDTNRINSPSIVLTNNTGSEQSEPKKVCIKSSFGTASQTSNTIRQNTSIKAKYLEHAHRSSKITIQKHLQRTMNAGKNVNNKIHIVKINEENKELLQILLAFFLLFACPPFAILVIKGKCSEFWIDLCLYIVGAVLFFTSVIIAWDITFATLIGWGVMLAALVYAISVVSKTIKG